ncbi:unnamed protein product [Fusarium graminearum]|nr:unnamed protein product [Fusarium graminearum]
MPFCLNAADNFPGLASPHPKKESSVFLTSTVERHSSGGAKEVLVSSRRLLTGTANCTVGALSGAGFSSSGIQIPYLYLLDSTLPFGFQIATTEPITVCLNGLVALQRFIFGSMRSGACLFKVKVSASCTSTRVPYSYVRILLHPFKS